MNRDENLAAQLRQALSDRDRQALPPAFAALLAAPTLNSAIRFRRVAFAGAIGGVLALGIVMLQVYVRQPTQISHRDLALARQLSSQNYWRVPSDAILMADSSRRSVLPNVEAFEMSLEESLL